MVDVWLLFSYDVGCVDGDWGGCDGVGGHGDGDAVGGCGSLCRLWWLLVLCGGYVHEQLARTDNNDK